MRILFTLFSALLFFYVNGQPAETQVSYTEESATFEKQNFLDTFDYIFLTRESTKSLWKFDLTGLTLDNIRIARDFRWVGISWSNRIQVEYERKLNNSFSINGLLAHRFFWTYNGSFTEGPNSVRFDYLVPLDIAIEPRWYINMGKKVKKGQRASNFSGTYLGLTVGNSIIRKVNSQKEAVIDHNNWRVMMNVGMQLRIFKNGFIHYNIANGFRYFGNQRWGWNYHTNFGLGLAFGKGGEDSKQRYCEAFKCHLEEKTMFKINLLRTLPMIGKKYFQTYIGFGYERKLWDSAFALNIESDFGYVYFHSNDGLRSSTSWGLSSNFTVEPRYYYSLKKRIAKGNAANNLSGTYIGMLYRINVVWGESTQTLPDEVQYRRHIRSQLMAAPVWGFQHRIFKNGYFDYKLGFGARGGIRQLNLFNQANNFSWQFLTELKVGLAF